jgi:hypothetical protein
MPTFQIGKSTPFLLHAGGSANSVIIANQDTTNSIIVGSELGIYTAQSSGTTGGLLSTPDITEIVPGQSYTFDGSQDIYALAVTGNPVVNVAPGAQNTQVALAGTNMVTPSTPLAFAKSTITVPPNGNHILGPTMLNQPSYELQVQVSTNVAATVPFIDMTVIWNDTVSGLVVAEEEWVLGANSPIGTPNVYVIKGPTKGNQVTLNFVNLDSGFGIQNTFTMVVNSRSLNRDKIYPLSYAAPPGFVSSGVAGFTNVIATVNGMNVPASGSSSRLFPPYAGDVWFWVDQQGNTAANAFFELQVAPTSFFGSAPFFGAGPSGGTPTGQGTVMRWPRGHVLLTYTNNGVSPSTVNAKVIALDENN